LEVVATTTNADELLFLPFDEESLLILDLSLPNSDKINTVKKLADKYPHLCILTIGEKESPGQLKEIMQAGASGYLYKRQKADDMIEAIKKVSEGDTYLSDETISKLYHKSESDNVSTTASADLTKREREVLELICRELTNREIAELLSISVRTVDAHRRNILQKTGAKNTAGLVKFAIINQIYSLS
jgi:DNA-binding NarL/FixJ family response regulator